jgi:glycosyltransferase involved in cell wall biosynthesis
MFLKEKKKNKYYLIKKMAKINLTVVIPTYNETPEILQETINDLTNSLKKSNVEKYEILAINDGSKEKYDYTKIKGAEIIKHKINKGYGAAIKTGIKNSKYEWIAITDSDGTYPNKELNKLTEHCPDFDMAIGKRDAKGIPLIRKFPKFVLTKTASFLAGKNIQDLNSGLRVFRKEIAIKYWNLFPQRFSFTSTITMVCMTKGYDVKFVNIPYYKRKGKSAIKPIKDTIKFFTLVFKLALYFNPARFFMPLSAFFLVLAIMKGLRDFHLGGYIGNLALVFFFMSFQIFFFGLVAEIISKK